MDITIAICTHNRSSELDRTLASLRDLHIAERTVELLVVDNSSTDATQEVIARHHTSGLMPLRQIFESQTGLSHARNRAIEEARGQLLLFLDDDVDVSRSLLTTYWSAYQAAPSSPYFGGPIHPVFDGIVSDLAAAILRQRPGVYSQLDLGPRPIPLPARDGPWGANCCIRREAIGDTRFDPDLGYSGRGTISGEETEFLFRLAQRFGPGRWVPEAAVDHRIPAARASWEYVRKSAAGSGCFQARFERLHDPDSRGMIRRARSWWRARVADRALRTMRTTASLDEQVQLEFAAARARALVDESRGHR